MYVFRPVVSRRTAWAGGGLDVREETWDERREPLGQREGIYRFNEPMPPTGSGQALFSRPGDGFSSGRISPSVVCVQDTPARSVFFSSWELPVHIISWDLLSQARREFSLYIHR